MINLGYFSDFRGENTVIVCGNAKALRWIAERLRDLEEPTASPLKWSGHDFIRIRGDVEMTSFPVSSMDAISVEILASESARVSWHHSPEGWLESSEKISFLADAEGPGHIDISVSGGDAAILFSKDEYSDEWWVSANR